MSVHSRIGADASISIIATTTKKLSYNKAVENGIVKYNRDGNKTRDFTIPHDFWLIILLQGNERQRGGKAFNPIALPIERSECLKVCWFIMTMVNRVA